MPRSLPKKVNPLVLPEGSPAYDDLLARRRLGKTHLAVKPTQIGMSSATKPENLGPFEYAHLRAPLPKNLQGSEIFPSHSPQQHPETYFLMRRSKDGYVSATGMFKIAFPWAKLDEERSERDYLKSQEGTSDDEIAGNVWITPGFALQLAREYQMYDWVRALIDPTEIAQSPSSAKKHITSPPKYNLPPLETDAIPQLPPSTRTRSRRSASPSKRTPSRRTASPRKPRQTRAKKETTGSTTSAAAESLQSSLDETASTVNSETIHETVETDRKVNGEEKPTDDSQKTEAIPEEPSAKDKPSAKADAAPAKEEKPKADTESSKGDKDKTKKPAATTSGEGPSILPELPPEADSYKMIAEAKEMVNEANKNFSEQKKKAAGPSADKSAKKRKPVDDDEEDDEDSGYPVERVKRARVLEDKLKRERVRNRALVGVTAALAVAASLPYFF